MLLAVDVGNTDIVAGLSEGDRWVEIWRKPSKVKERPETYMQWLSLLFLESNFVPRQVTQVVYSSVVPNLNDALLPAFARMFGVNPVVIGPGTYPLMKVDIHHPYELGTDLFANAVAAHHRYQMNCVIVDFGTALTFTTVAKEGIIKGVAIAPGLKTAVRSLFANTAQLPEVPLIMPESPIGKNTVEAIQSGVLLGYEGLVKSMIQRIRREFDGHLMAIGTGGHSSVITTLAEEFTEIDKNLTLEGLRIIGEFTESEN